MKITDLMTMNVLMYLLLFGAAVAVYLIEKRDWVCTNSYDLWATCHKGDGMPYRGSKPSPSDSCPTLLKKIDLAANAERNSIKWRRSLILAATICVLVFGLVVMPGRLPEWTQMYVAVLLTTFVLYFNFNYYSYHRYKEPTEYIEESTDLLGEKIARGQC